MRENYAERLLALETLVADAKKSDVRITAGLAAGIVAVCQRYRLTVPSVVDNVYALLLDIGISN